MDGARERQEGFEMTSSVNAYGKYDAAFEGALRVTEGLLR